MLVGMEQVTATICGRTVAAIVPFDVEDPDLPAEFREGIARRRILMNSGTCPCGAEMTLAQCATVAVARRYGRNLATVAVAVRHEVGCPATTPGLNELIRTYLVRIGIDVRMPSDMAE